MLLAVVGEAVEEILDLVVTLGVAAALADVADLLNGVANVVEVVETREVLVSVALVLCVPHEILVVLALAFVVWNV